MASRAQTGGASASPIPLDVLLASLPSLPRPLLSRLTSRMIERMDEMDGDPDLGPTEEPCFASLWKDSQPGDEEDAEENGDGEP
jgi:hypothetical protein